MTALRLLLVAFLLVLTVSALSAPTPREMPVSEVVVPAGSPAPVSLGAPQPLRESDSSQSVAMTPSVVPEIGAVPPVAAASPTPKPSGTGARTAGRRVSTSAKAGGVSASPAASLIRVGMASNYGPKYSEHWIALPDGPGIRFVVCGPGDCRELVSTDAGPSKAMQRPPFNRVVDLPVGIFEVVCGVSYRMGLCPVTVNVLGRAH